MNNIHYLQQTSNMSYESFSKEAAAYLKTTSTAKRSRRRIQKENRPINKKEKHPLKKAPKVKRVKHVTKWLVSK